MEKIHIITNSIIQILNGLNQGCNTNYRLKKYLKVSPSTISGRILTLYKRGLVDYSCNRNYKITELGLKIIEISIEYDKINKKYKPIKEEISQNIEKNENLKLRGSTPKKYRKAEPPFYFFYNLSLEEKKVLIKNQYDNILQNKDIILPIRIIKENLNLISRQRELPQPKSKRI